MAKPPRRRRATAVGLATVEVLIRFPNGMRMRHTTKVGSAEALQLWDTLLSDEAAPEPPAAPVKPAEAP